MGERLSTSHAGAPPIAPPDTPSTPEVDANGYIIFKDPEVARICAENWGDGVGITLEQAASVTNISTVFKENTEITSFNEFGKFAKAQAIPANAFNGCSALSAIDLSNVTSLGASALYGCTSLEIADLAMPNLTSLGKNALYGVKIKKISSLEQITELPAATTSTQNFGDKSVLEEVVFTVELSIIPEASFYNYQKLYVDLVLPNLTSIGRWAFQRTGIRRVLDLGRITALTSTNAEHGTFAYCSNLESAILPQSIISIGTREFRNCPQLNSLIIKATVPPTLGSEQLLFNSPNCIIYVHDSSVEMYRTATNWSTYASRIKGIGELPIDNPTLYNEIKEYL